MEQFLKLYLPLIENLHGHIREVRNILQLANFYGLLQGHQSQVRLVGQWQSCKMLMF